MVVSTISSQQKKKKKFLVQILSEETLEEFACFPHVYVICFFSKILMRLIGDSQLSIAISLRGHVMDWWPVHGVTWLLPGDGKGECFNSLDPEQDEVGFGNG